MAKEPTMSIGWIRHSRRRMLLSALLLSVFLRPQADAGPPRIRALFLGDEGHHRPKDRFHQLEPVLRDRGIDLSYTDRLADPNLGSLRSFYCLVVFANNTENSPKAD